MSGSGIHCTLSSPFTHSTRAAPEQPSETRWSVQHLPSCSNWSLADQQLCWKAASVIARKVQVSEPDLQICSCLTAEAHPCRTLFFSLRPCQWMLRECWYTHLCMLEWARTNQTHNCGGPSELTLIWLRSWLQVGEQDANNRFILVFPALSRYSYKHAGCNSLVCIAFKKWLCKRLQFIWLTRRWRLNLRLFLGISSAEDFWRGLLPSLNLALEGKQVLNVLFFQGAGCAARSANVQGGCQLTPLLVFINLPK